MAPIDLFDRLLSYYYKKDAQKAAPVIPVSTAAALSVLYTLVYVIPFYLSSSTRPSPALSRDAPSVIRARIRAVVFSCVVTTLMTLYVSTDKGGFSRSEILKILGWWPVSVGDVLRSLSLVALLFAGPLFETGVIEGRWRQWVTGRALAGVLTSSVGWRNYVAGPITEELVFRSLIIPLHIFARLPPSKLIFTTPLYFGIAHIHHFYEFKLIHPRTPLLPALLRSLLQFAYTSLFGFYAAFVFLRTGSLGACILTHSFCNAMGLPRFWGKVGSGDEDPVAGTEIAMGPPVGESDGFGVRRKDTDGPRRAVPRGRSLSTAWTVTYYVLLVVGAAAFYINMWRLTESTNALVAFGGHENA